MPRRSRRINPHHHVQRTGLRVVGGLLAVTGGVFMAVGLISFFSAFGGGGMPQNFWCVFVGMPLLGIGLAMLKFGYMGSVVRYVAGETAPVATDTLNYVADETRGSMRKVASSIAGGIRDGMHGEQTSARTACRSCGHDNDADARFCDQCGGAMSTERACPQCAKVNDDDARFCDGCGTALA